jgi:orotate phosphoribosyltransferase
MIASEKREHLTEIIKREGIVIRDVILSSGKRTSYYYDIKRVVGNGRALALIAELILDEIIMPNFMDVRSIGGLEIGSIPLSTAIMMTHPDAKKGSLGQFIVRKSLKEHGLEKRVEGILQEPVLIIDDVLTSGNSIQQVVDILRKDNQEVKGVICVLDREDESGSDFKRAWGGKFYSLFCHSDFKEYIYEKSKQVN